jgi:hypothetical protein
MTRKEALATLYRLRDAYLDLLYAQDRATFAASEALRQQSFKALMTLVDAVHGKSRGINDSLFLCEVCYLRWADLSTQEPLWVCAECHKDITARALEPDEGTATGKKLAPLLGGDGASDEMNNSNDLLKASRSYSSVGCAGTQEERSQA